MRVLCSVAVVLMLTSACAAGEWCCIEAEQFDHVEAERRSFRGVVGVVFPKKESAIRTALSVARPVEAEVWARVYFPWGGQDALALTVGGKQLAVTARTAGGGGRWDIGNFQVWHWVKAGTVGLDAGTHELSLAPARGAGQRVDRVAVTWGRAPAWTQPWLRVGYEWHREVEWGRARSLVIPAADFELADARLEKLGAATVAVLVRDTDRLSTVVRTRRAARAHLWARVFFDGKNMFEGLTMQEMARSLYLSLDGQLVKTVCEQNGRQWHWVATDEPVDLSAGYHLVTLQKQGPPVKVDRVVLYRGANAADEGWFGSDPPAMFPLPVARGPERGRAGNWRAHVARGSAALEFLGERAEAAEFPVRIAFGREPTTLDLVRAAGLDDDPANTDPTPAQQTCVWVKNSGQPLDVHILYTDRSGEAFLQPLHDGSAWTGWRLLSASIPLRVPAGEAFYDHTGYVTSHPATPQVAADAPSKAAAGIRRAGGDGNGVPDFPLEVRALRFAKADGEAEVVFGEPFLASPFSLRMHLKSQQESRVAIELEVRSSLPADATAMLCTRFGDTLADPTDAATRRALLRPVDVPVPARGKATLTLEHPAEQPGIFFLEACIGREPARRVCFAVGGTWQKKLAELRADREREAGAFHFSPDRAPRPLKKPDGAPLRRDDVAAAYGKGLAVTDGGLDVCSLAYADKRGFAFPLRAEGWDLSDAAGWPRIRVPIGVLAIDPELGRGKFAEANSQELCLAAALPTGFGVPGPPITVRGDIAYVGPGEGHYSIVDVKDKARPRVVGNLNSWYFSHEMLLFRTFGYFESSKRGLILVDDLSNPRRPGPLRNVHFSRGRYGRLKHVFEDDAAGYSVGGSPTALWVHDLTRPLYPREIATIEGVGALFPAGETMLAYVGEAVRAIDVTRPRKPRLLDGELPREKWETGKGEGKKTHLARIIAASADRVALLADKRIDVFRCSAGRAFVAEKIASLDVPEKSGRRLFGTFHRGLFYLIDGKSGPGQYSLGATSPASRWFVFALEDGKTTQASLYEHPWPSAFGNITIQGDTAYVSDYNYGMWVFDLSSPGEPKRVGGAVTAGESDALWLDGTTAYQWQTFGGAVFLIDISNPLAPRRLGEYWDGAWIPYGNSRRGNYTVAGKDGFLYVPRQRRGLLVVDVRNPARPKQTGEFLDGQGKPVMVSGACIDVRGDRAFVLNRKRLLLYDVADAAKPKLLSALDVPESDLICARGGRVYLAHKKGAFTVVDAADPAKPAVLATLDLAPLCPRKMSEVISGIAVAKGYAYLTARRADVKGGNFLHILDVRDPRQPRLVRTGDPRPDLPDEPCSVWADFDQDVIADGDYLFVGNYGAIECYDISRPAAPRFFGRRHVGYQWSVGRKRGDFLFVPALSGLLVLRAPSSSQALVGKLEVQARF